MPQLAEEEDIPKLSLTIAFDFTPEMDQSDTVVQSKEQSHDFFFYGTLCVPAILVRVLGHKGENLTFQDAILPQYTRHCVKGEDYPAVIDTEQRKGLVGDAEAISKEEINTRGTLVYGLSYKDVQALDVFEGNQYARKKLTIRTLGPKADLHSVPVSLSDPSSRIKLESQETESGDVGAAEAWVYVWTASLAGLEKETWSFQDFVKEKAILWVGANTIEYDEVDRHRALQEEPAINGLAVQTGSVKSPLEDADESQIVGKIMDGYPEFGHGMLKYWKFAPGYVNMNHGSYGSPPRPVIEAMHKLSDQIESNPDLFMRRSYFSLLEDVRERTAKLIGARTDEVVIVPNATHGINTIATNIKWVEGDVILIYLSTYGAVGQTMKFICDSNPGVTLEVIDVTFPCSHADVVRKTETVLAKYNKVTKPNYTGEARPEGLSSDKRVRMLVLDAIASNPGVVFPWEELVGLCHKYGVLSLVDAAHAIGQIKTDVKRADCDFWVSNCHKWLLSHRGGSVMYVPLKNQHLIRSSFPTGAGYESAKYPTEGISRPWSFVKQYEWNGTVDWTPFMSIKTALEFREHIGGEDRIMEYCHSVAVQGGKKLAKRWGTLIMENEEGTLTAAMVNVELPDVPTPKDIPEVLLQLRYFEDGLFAGNCYAAPYRHDDKWWARFSVQVWNELGDFDKVGDVLEKICAGIRSGEHLEQKISEQDLEREARHGSVRALLPTELV
ncbi:pyridoxal phosphate-dependent transferase [Naematelia encephala]|uniref:Pyridoxal phosphate-dependent transferase n=1 Tax=Naematelia encephala TaxID=71784 RepID=A0A1Y2B1Q2_9TREE|nr:pyridoxal phosphate-dependent transferase [Naematelia encephala]